MPSFSNLDIQSILLKLVALVIAIAIHEFAHAATATALGDDTPRRQGRLTLNPATHFDPLGFFMLLILAVTNRGFAWGRPVQVNTYALRGGRRGMALVAIAGPLSNLVQAAVAVAIMNGLGMAGTTNVELLSFLRSYAFLNILLASFNLLPVPPLDGFNVLMGVVSDFWVQRLAPLYQYGAGLLLLLVFIGGRYAYQYAIDPMASVFSRLVGFS